MPKPWNETVEAHRREVRDAIMDATAALVSEHGLLSVTMSQIAQETGVARATLYNYFVDVEAIVSAWHQRHINDHLAQLAVARDQAKTPAERLEAVLMAYAMIARDSAGHRGSELAAFLHRDSQLRQAEKRLHAMVAELVADSVAHGTVRNDIPADELADFCLSALGAARHLPSTAAVRRLVGLTMATLKLGLMGPARPRRRPPNGRTRRPG